MSRNIIQISQSHQGGGRSQILTNDLPLGPLDRFIPRHHELPKQQLRELLILFIPPEATFELRLRCRGFYKPICLPNNFSRLLIHSFHEACGRVILVLTEKAGASRVVAARGIVEGKDGIDKGLGVCECSRDDSEYTPNIPIVAVFD
ncbi:MAG: hypothetical protein Q9218_002883 [Villophora microphyllina]